MTITKTEKDGYTDVKIYMKEEDISWFVEMFANTDDNDGFFWAGDGVTLWFKKLEGEE